MKSSQFTFFHHLLQFQTKPFATLVILRPSVKELGGHLCANAAQRLSKKCRSGAIGDTVTDLTGPRFEPQTSCSRDEHVTA